MRDAALVGLFAALLVLPPLGQRVIATTDEARFALLARDMLDRGAWFGAEIRGELYRNKPPLYPWSIAAVSRLGGRVSQRSAHAPIAVAAIGAAVFTTLLGQSLFGRRAGLWAGLVVATTYGFFEGSQLLLPDMIVVAFETVAAWAFWRSVVAPARAVWRVVFYAAVAFALFAKGPMGLVPFLVTGAWLLTEHGRPWSSALRALWSPVGLVVFALITAGWLAPYLGEGGRTFAGNVVVQDWLAWYLGAPDAAHLGAVGVDVVGGLLPWTAMLLLSLARMRDHWRDPAARFACIVFLVPLAVALAAFHHRTRYLLPIYPGAALLVAWWAETDAIATGWLARLVRWIAPASGLALAVAISAPWALPLRSPLGSLLGWKGAVVGTCGAIIAVIMWWTLDHRRIPALVIGTALVTGVALEAGIWAYDAWTNRADDFGAVAQRIERYAHGGEVAILDDRFLPIDFYLGRSLTRLPSMDELSVHLLRPDRPIAVVAGTAWPRVEHALPAGVRAVDTVRVREHEMILLQRVAG
jgi:4-amino-4-deoxy-L-arabinose transferase-like glycosyltransferase